MMPKRKLQMRDGKVVAPPFTSRWCETCEQWIFVDASPFGENDRTKPIRDMIHVDVHHPELVEHDGRGIGASYPWMISNEVEVEAVIEDARIVAGRSVIVGVNS
jgi:hypothetical protein